MSAGKIKMFFTGFGHMGIIHPKYGYMEGTAQSIRETCDSIEANDKKAAESIGKDPYYTPLKTVDGEINGFTIKCGHGGDIPDKEYEIFMEKKLFLELVNAWTTPQMDDETFEDACDKKMCSDWSKQDIHNNCFGGYWKYEEGTYAREKAYYLSRAYSIYRLSMLPYPRRVLLMTIDIGCGNRQESVAYSNFLCDWVFRKYKQVYGDELPLYYPKDPIMNEDEFIEHYKNNLKP